MLFRLVILPTTLLLAGHLVSSPTLTAEASDEENHFLHHSLEVFGNPYRGEEAEDESVSETVEHTSTGASFDLYKDLPVLPGAGATLLWGHLVDAGTRQPEFDTVAKALERNDIEPERLQRYWNTRAFLFNQEPLRQTAIYYQTQARALERVEHTMDDVVEMLEGQSSENRRYLDLDGPMQREVARLKREFLYQHQRTVMRAHGVLKHAEDEFDFVLRHDSEKYARIAFRRIRLTGPRGPLNYARQVTERFSWRFRGANALTCVPLLMSLNRLLEDSGPERGETFCPLSPGVSKIRDYFENHASTDEDL